MANSALDIIDRIAGGSAGGETVPPNPLTYYSRGNERVRGLVFHHSAGSSLPGAMTAGQHDGVQKGTGAQYYIDTDGSIYQYAPDTTASHNIAGPSKDTRTDAGQPTHQLRNANVIGVEVIAPNSKSFTQAQKLAAAELAKYLSAKYDIAPNMIVGHGALQGGPGGNKQADEGIPLAKFAYGSMYPTPATPSAQLMAERAIPRPPGNVPNVRSPWVPPATQVARQTTRPGSQIADDRLDAALRSWGGIDEGAVMTPALNARPAAVGIKSAADAEWNRPAPARAIPPVPVAPPLRPVASATSVPLSGSWNPLDPNSAIGSFFSRPWEVLMPGLTTAPTTSKPTVAAPIKTASIAPGFSPTTPLPELDIPTGTYDPATQSFPGWVPTPRTVTPLPTTRVAGAVQPPRIQGTDVTNPLHGIKNLYQPPPVPRPATDAVRARTHAALAETTPAETQWDATTFGGGAGGLKPDYSGWLRPPTIPAPPVVSSATAPAQRYGMPLGSMSIGIGGPIIPQWQPRQVVGRTGVYDGLLKGGNNPFFDSMFPGTDRAVYQANRAVNGGRPMTRQSIAQTLAGGGMFFRPQPVASANGNALAQSGWTSPGATTGTDWGHDVNAYDPRNPTAYQKQIYGL